MPEKAQVTTHKRQKIEDSSRTMFIWVAAMSAVVGLCSVVAWFVFQQAAFRIKVVDEKNKTVKTLRADNAAVPDLKDNIRVLETNSALRSARANDDDKALQAVLDALPAEANSLALGASLQEHLVKGVSGLTLETLTVDPVSSALTAGNVVTSTTSSTKPANTVTFKLTVSSTDVNKLKEMLTRFERSIRVIDIDSLSLERSDRNYTMTMQAHAYYEPAKSIELHDKVVKP